MLHLNGKSALLAGKTHNKCSLDRKKRIAIIHIIYLTFHKGYIGQNLSKLQTLAFKRVYIHNWQSSLEM